jgi:catechol 2,3-dioxygenase-like lactoylglutathione lyase family enzyme
MVFVSDVDRSIAFYAQLGFEVGNTFSADGATKPTWAWLTSDGAQLMLAAADEPIIPQEQRTLFYIYTDDVAAAHDSVAKAALNPGPITTPFYAPRGEFELRDPDGFVVMITHT